VVRREKRSQDGSSPKVKAAPVPKSGTVLAFDFGEKRVGVAVGDLALRIAHPLATISAEDNAIRFGEIQKLITEWIPVALVVGLPMHADGAEHEVSRLARRFAQRLEGRFGIRATLVDERLTSRAAEMRLKESGLRSDKVKHGLDAAAAGEILEAYFRSVPSST
jgi:putative holliday junction resolvase